MRTAHQLPDSLRVVSSLVPQGIEVIGTEDAETLLGSIGGDHIVGMGGDDLIYGYGGFDDLFAPGYGNATIYGGAGGDDIDVREGSSLCFGGTGNDEFWFFGARDSNEQHTVYGGEGVDDALYPGVEDALIIDLRRTPDATLQTGERLFGIENVSAGSNSDIIFGNAVANVLEGHRGEDSIYGGAGGDSIQGVYDDDMLYGGDGRDTLEGGRGSDRLMGDGGRDFMYGNEGFDTLTGGAGSDVMYGGSSADRFVFNLGSDTGGEDRILDFQVGKDRIEIAGVAGAGNAPEITITTLANGLQMVIVGDVANPLFEIGVRARGNMITESDISFLFV